MKTINRSTLLNFPSENALPPLSAVELRDMEKTEPSPRAWIAEDGCACCLIIEGLPCEIEDDGTPGEWFEVVLDEPDNIESSTEMDARAWLEKFLK